MGPSTALEPCSLKDLLGYFLRLGTFGFGGPIALAARMEKDLVEGRRWISREDYVEGLAFSQLSPGPLAAQLAMYIGWIRAGRPGAAVVSFAFVLPSFLMAVAIAAAYVAFGQLSWIQALFYGVGAAVIGIIAQSAYRLACRTIGKDILLWLLFTTVAVTTVWTGSEIVWLFLLCGVVAVLWRSRTALLSTSILPSVGGWGWLVAGLSGPAPAGVIGSLAFFFAKAGAFVFGSGLAIVPFLYGGVVTRFHWLTEQQFLDAIAVAMITPGPVVITAAFIGYLVAGFLGGTVAASAVFVPPFLIVILAAPYYQRFARNPQVKAFVQGVTAAAVGAIAGAAVILAKRALVDFPTVLIALAVFAALFSLKRIPAPVLIYTGGSGWVVISTYEAIMNMDCRNHKTLWVVGCSAVLFALLPAASGQTLKKIAAFDLPGPGGKRFDYLTIDYEDHYLLSAHLAAGILYVIDTADNRLVKAIPGVPGVEGVEYVPGLKKVYTSDSGDNTIGVVDLRSMKVVKRLATAAKPDGSAYAEPFRKLYVSDERGKAEAIIDVGKDEIIRTLQFDSETGMPQYDPVARKVYVNLQDQNILAVIDPASDEVVARYPVGRCRGNHGMALDAEDRRAFLACEGNELLTVFDLDAHRPIAFLPLAAGPDVVKFDPGLRRVYVACSSGAISVIQEDDPSHFRVLENFPVQKKVHSLAVDMNTHRVYAPEQEEDGRPVARMIVYEAAVGRQQAKPGARQ